MVITKRNNPWTFYKFFSEIYPEHDVTCYRIDEKANLITLDLSPNLPPVCPHCHSHNVVVHQYRVRTIKEPTMYGFPTVVKVKYSVLCCNFCGCTATERINFKADGFNGNKRLRK